MNGVVKVNATFRVRLFPAAVTLEAPVSSLHCLFCRLPRHARFNFAVYQLVPASLLRAISFVAGRYPM